VILGSNVCHVHVRCPSFRFRRGLYLQLTHLNDVTGSDQGNYADDCLVHRVTISKCYIVATVRLLLPIPHLFYPLPLHHIPSHPLFWSLQ
jgi:hypothetical protein